MSRCHRQIGFVYRAVGVVHISDVVVGADVCTACVFDGDTASLHGFTAALVFVQINLFALAVNGFTGTRTGDKAHDACTGRIQCAVIGLSCLTRCHREIGFVYVCKAGVCGVD